MESQDVKLAVSLKSAPRTSASVIGLGYAREQIAIVADVGCAIISNASVVAQKCTWDRLQVVQTTCAESLLLRPRREAENVAVAQAFGGEMRWAE